MVNILIIIENLVMANVIKDHLSKQDYNVTIAMNSHAAINLSSKKNYDLYIIDLKITGVSGYGLSDIIARSQKSAFFIYLVTLTKTVEILMKNSTDKIAYLPKPIDLNELSAKTKTLLVTNQKLVKSNTGKNLLVYFHLNYSKSSLIHNSGKKLSLSGTEIRLLEILGKNENSIVGVKYLLYELWGNVNQENKRKLDGYINRIRIYLKVENKVKLIIIKNNGYLTSVS